MAWREQRGTFESLLLQIESLRGMTQLAKRIGSAVRAAEKASRPPSVPDLPAPTLGVDLVLEPCLGDHPIPSGLVIPRGFDLRCSGVDKLVRRKVGIDKIPVCDKPVVITGRLIDVDTKEVQLRVEWLRNRQWRSRTVPRAMVLNARTLVELAAVDFPVGSDNAGDLANYLRVFDDANVTVLPKARVSSHMGWQGTDGEDGFVWGQTLLTGTAGGAEPSRIDDLPPTTWTAESISLNLEESVRTIAEGFHARGSFEGWCAAVEMVRTFPSVMLALYASLVPPLLSILRGAPNFSIEWVGETSWGKTTAQRFGASAWGVPNERATDAIIFGWDGTRVGVERLIHVLTDLPTFLDDTKNVRSPDLVIKVLYMVSQGRTALRGAQVGMQKQATSRTVLLSSGEAPSTSFGKSGGADARLLSLWGSPFGAEANRELADRFRNQLLDHYGHMGPRFVNWLIDRRAERGELIATYREAHARWAKRAGSSPVAGRVAEYIALMEVAADIVHRHLDVPPAGGEPFELALATAIQSAAGADKAAEALKAVHGWAVRQPSRFCGRLVAEASFQSEDPALSAYNSSGTVGKEPLQGWLGAWSYGDRWEAIAFVPEPLKTFLDDQGFDSEAVIRVWHDRGLLAVEKGRKTKRAQIGGVPVYCITVKRQAFDQEGT